jgi:hypothetical protein
LVKGVASLLVVLGATFAVSRTYAEKANAAGVCAMDFVAENRLGISLTLIGAGLGFLASILASHPVILSLLAGICFLSGLSLLLYPYLQRESDAQIALRLRNRVQRLLDDIGEEPKMKYQVPDKEWKARLEIWRKHNLQLVHTFRRRHLPKIQDFIHRLGEKGITDDPLNIMIDNDPKDYAAIKEIVDRLGILGSRWKLR